MIERQYTKLDKDIVYSSLWREDSDICKVWVSLLALQDMDGEIHKNLAGIADLIRVPIEKCREAIKLFCAPDPNSRCKDYEGRKLLDLPDGGWKIANSEKFQALGWSEDKKRFERERKAKWRDKQDQLEIGGQTIQVTPGRFQPPSLGLVKAEFVRRGSTEVEAEKFFNFYESKGWMVGKNKMKKVESAVANWIARDKDHQQGDSKQKLEAELENLTKRRDAIQAGYSAHQTWAAQDLIHYKEIQARRRQIKTQLGLPIEERPR